MRIKAAVLALALSLFCLPALAQFNGRSEVSVDFTGNFQKQATGFGITDSPSYSGGFLINYRYHFDRWSALEVNYGRTNFTQYYSTGDQTQSNANEVTFAYVNTFGVSRHARFRPFVEAGTGGLIFSPIQAGSLSAPLTQDRVAFLYGGGVDWRAMHHVAVRLGYRGLIYKAPDFALGDQTTNALTQMAEPYVGVVFHF
ncbi:MAG TPA: outer membrane beta-barrel protein [Candidatus Dormibacteraeota bacterium]|nr:outer membrane beta-barrel protein [Candidatus Dormibacteraeota bacterium]